MWHDDETGLPAPGLPSDTVASGEGPRLPFTQTPPPGSPGHAWESSVAVHQHRGPQALWPAQALLHRPGPHLQKQLLATWRAARPARGTEGRPVHWDVPFRGPESLPCAGPAELPPACGSCPRVPAAPPTQPAPLSALPSRPPAFHTVPSTSAVTPLPRASSRWTCRPTQAHRHALPHPLGMVQNSQVGVLGLDWRPLWMPPLYLQADSLPPPGCLSSPRPAPLLPSSPGLLLASLLPSPPTSRLARPCPVSPTAFSSPSLSDGISRLWSEMPVCSWTP